MTSSDKLSLMNYFSVSCNNLRDSAAHFWMPSIVGSEKYENIIFLPSVYLLVIFLQRILLTVPSTDSPDRMQLGYVWKVREEAAVLNSHHPWSFFPLLECS